MPLATVMHQHALWLAAEPDLLKTDEMSETSPLAEEQHAHRLMLPVLLHSQQMIWAAAAAAAAAVWHLRPQRRLSPLCAFSVPPEGA